VAGLSKFQESYEEKMSSEIKTWQIVDGKLN